MSEPASPYARLYETHAWETPIDGKSALSHSQAATLVTHWFATGQTVPTIPAGFVRHAPDTTNEGDTNMAGGSIGSKDGQSAREMVPPSSNDGSPIQGRVQPQPLSRPGK